MLMSTAEKQVYILGQNNASISVTPYSLSVRHHIRHHEAAQRISPFSAYRVLYKFAVHECFKGLMYFSCDLNRKGNSIITHAANIIVSSKGPYRQLLDLRRNVPLEQ